MLFWVSETPFFGSNLVAAQAYFFMGVIPFHRFFSDISHIAGVLSALKVSPLVIKTSTCKAFSPSLFFDDIIRCKRMTMLTRRFPVIYSTPAMPATKVFSLRYRLQVIRTYTTRISAQMVNYKIRRYLPISVFVRNSVCATQFIVKVKKTISVFLGCFPQPACRCFLNLRPKTDSKLSECFSHISMVSKIQSVAYGI